MSNLIHIVSGVSLCMICFIISLFPNGTLYTPWFYLNFEASVFVRIFFASLGLWVLFGGQLNLNVERLP